MLTDGSLQPATYNKQSERFLVNSPLLRHEEDPYQHEEDIKAVKEEWVTLIRMHEQSFQFKKRLVMTWTSDAQKLQDEILNLKRLL
jgi:hypothetical protein